VLWTGLPIFAFGIFDAKIPARVAMKFPQLYALGQQDYHINLKMYLWWMFIALAEAIIIFFFVVLGLESAGFHSGITVSSDYMGLLLMTALIIVVNLKIAYEVSTWGKAIIASFILTGLVWPVFLAIYSGLFGILPVEGILKQIEGPHKEIQQNSFGMFFTLFHGVTNATGWFALIFIAGTHYVFHVAAKYLYRIVNPQLYHIVAENPNASMEEIERLYPAITKMSNRPSKSRRFICC